MGITIGVIPQYLEDLEKLGGLTASDIARATGAQKATVTLWKAGDVRPGPLEGLILSRLHYVVNRLLEHHASDETRAWLLAPHPQLGGERTLDMIQRGRTVEVLEVIDRLENAAFL